MLNVGYITHLAGEVWLHAPVSGTRNYFQEAAAVLEQAMKATGLGEQAALLDEALRLNRLGLAEERAKLKAWVSDTE